MKEKWIPITECLPEIGQEVIVFCPGKERRRVTALCRLIYHEGATAYHWDNVYGGGNLHIGEAVTHWMPMPEPPH